MRLSGGDDISVVPIMTVYYLVCGDDAVRALIEGFLAVRGVILPEAVVKFGGDDSAALDTCKGHCAVVDINTRDMRGRA